jgi:hypothetical protein
MSLAPAKRIRFLIDHKHKLCRLSNHKQQVDPQRISRYFQRDNHGRGYYSDVIIDGYPIILYHLYMFSWPMGVVKDISARGMIKHAGC